MQDNCPAFESLEGGEWGLEGASASRAAWLDRGQLRPCAGPPILRPGDFEAPATCTIYFLHPAIRVGRKTRGRVVRVVEGKGNGRLVVCHFVDLLILIFRNWDAVSKREIRCRILS